MTTFTGVVDAVRSVPLGSPLAADASIGATTLFLVDTSDFDERDGGTVSLNGTQMVYSAVDEVAGTITVPALTVAASADDFVTIWDVVNNVGVTELRANISTDDDIDQGAAIDARVNLALVPLLAPGLRDDGAGEVAQVQLIDGEWVLTDLPGLSPFIGGKFVGEVLIYAGPPKAGNLVFAVSGTGGVDQYGNVYKSGATLVEYVNLSDLLSLLTSAGAVAGKLIVDDYLQGGLLLSSDSSLSHWSGLGINRSGLGLSIPNGIDIGSTGVALYWDNAAIGLTVGGGPGGKYYARHATFSMAAVVSGTTTTITSTTTIQQNSDYGSGFASGVFTAPVAAFYDAFIHANSVGAGQTSLSCTIRKNGSAIANDHVTGSGDDVSSAAVGIWMNVGDTFDFRITQVSGANKTVTGDIAVARRL